MTIQERLKRSDLIMLIGMLALACGKKAEKKWTAIHRMNA